jgi:RHS repeat-associated protein
MTATAVSPSGTIASVAFYGGTTLLGTATTPVSGQPNTYSFTLSTGLAAGTYSLTALATDALGATTTSAAVSITVNPHQPPSVALTVPAANAVFAVSSTITLTASASDVGGTITQVAFYGGTTLLGTATTPVSGQPGTYSLTLAAGLAGGAYSLTAVATDSLGFTATSAPVSITVDAPPTVTLTAPADGASFNALAPVTFTATAASQNGTIASVSFFGGTTLLGTATTPVPGQPNTYSFNLAGGLAVGTYAITAVATDNFGMTTTSASSSVTVVQPRSLTVIAGPGQSATLHNFGANSVTTPFVAQKTSTTLAQTIGSDYSEYLQSIVVSTNYPSGTPYNFATVNPDGTYKQFSSIHGLTDEVSLAIAKHDSGGPLTMGGFIPGQIFCGSGVGGVVVRISPDGSTINNPWVTLPGETGLLRGAVYIDRTGVWGGDLIVSTTAGGIWRVTSAGVPTKVYQLPAADWEALITLPNNATQWGPWAGKIVVGDEGGPTVHAIDTQGNSTTYQLGVSSLEYFNLIPAGQNLYGVDQDGTLAAVPSSAFNNTTGQLIATSEFSETWTNIHWNGASFEVTPLSVQTGTFESSTFAPEGIAPLPPGAPPASVQLNGTVNDVGLPTGSTLVTTWSEVSGPGYVMFNSPNSAATTAVFTQPGSYVLQLSATDGQLSGTDTLTVTVAQNTPPSVGVQLFLASPNTSTPVQLLGSVTDDGNPVGGTLTSLWSQVTGPGSAIFSNAAVPASTATFSTPGIYTLELSASDSLDSSFEYNEAFVGLLYPDSIPRDEAAWWSFNGLPTELVHGDHDIQLFDGLKYGPGIVSEGLVFNGTNSYGYVPASADLDIGSSSKGFTIELWANPATLKGGTPILTWCDFHGIWSGIVTVDAFTTEYESYPVGNGATTQLTQDGAGGADFHAFIVDTTGAAHTITATNILTANTWQHLALTYDEVSGIATIYDNGVIVAQQILGVFHASTTYDLYFGSNPFNSTLAVFNGMLDEVTFFDRPLEQSEVLAIYQSGAAGKPPPGSIAPIVNGGTDVDVATTSLTATLDGSLTPGNGPGPLTTSWTLLNGPGSVVFGNTADPSTTATFSAPGIYLLELDGNDGLSVAGSSVVTARVGVEYFSTDPGGLVDWWPLNGTPHEVTHGGDDIQFVNGLTYGPGEVSEGLVFDGVHSYGFVAPSPDIDIGSSAQGFTIEFWVNSADATRTAPFLEWGSLAGQIGLIIGERPSGSLQSQITVSMTASNGQGASYSSGAKTIAQGTWSHVAFTYDRPTGSGTCYINGILVTQALPIGGPAVSPLTTYSLFFGHDESGGVNGAYFKGGLDEVTFYNRPLLPAEVTAIYRGGPNGKSPFGSVAPTVNAGPDLVVTSLSSRATLNGTATAGSIPGPLTVAWSVVSGPGTVTFASPGQAATTATFSVAGVYVLELDANDGLNVAQPGRMVVRVAEDYANPDPPGLSDWWPLNSEPHEVVHGGHDIQFVNNLAYGPGEVGTGLLFDGVNSYGVVPGATDLDIGSSTQGFTIELWVNSADSTRIAPFLEWGKIGQLGLSIGERPSGAQMSQILVVMTNAAGSGDTFTSGSKTIQQGTWDHVAFTYDETTGIGSTYVNGVLAAQAATAPITPVTTYSLYFGADPTSNGGGPFFKGGLDEVTFYGRPLAPTEILAIYESGANGKSPVGTIPPTVNAGPDLNVPSVSSQAALNGTVTAGSIPGPLNIAWSVIDGPGTVTFANPNLAATTASFSAAGIYVLELDANDGLSAALPGRVVVRVAEVYANPDPPGMADWWPLNGEPHEVVNGGHDIQFVNNLVYGPGEVGMGLVFDGVSSYGVVPGASDLDIGSSAAGFTIELWVNSADSTRIAPFLEWGKIGQLGLSIGERPSGAQMSQILVVMTNAAGSGDTFTSGSKTIQQGTWDHVAFTYDKTTGIGSTYVNGVLAAQATTAPITPVTTYSLYFGADPTSNGAGPFFKGSLDEVTLYKRVLSPTEVLEIYDAGASGKSPIGSSPPTVNAGPDLVLTSLSSTATLNGTATPGSIPGPLNIAWSVIDGPGTVTFANPNLAATTASFSAAGIYVLELDANDGLNAAQPGRVVVRVAEVYANPDPPGMADWWPLNGEPHEVVNGGHDVQFVNNLVYGAGEVGMGLVFDGVSSYGVVPEASDLDIGSSAAGFTVELWVNSADSTRIAPFLEWGKIGQLGLSIGERPSGAQMSQILVLMTNAAGSGDTFTSGSKTIQQGAWDHVAFTYDKTTGIGSTYVNGILAAQATTAPITPVTTYSLYFGADPTSNGAGPFFKGSLDEVTLYKRPLAPAEILAIYNSGAKGKSPFGTVPPTVNAGPDLNLPSVSSQATLNGTATPGSMPGPLNIAWSVLEGPGTVTFANPNLAATTATFSAIGVYVLELDANDGLNAAQPGRVVVRVAEVYANPDPPGMADWWPLNGEPHEVVNGGHDIQFVNNLVYGPGEVGMGLVFDGVSSYGVVPGASDLDIGSSAAGFTVELWVNSADSTRIAPFLEWGKIGQLGLSIGERPSGAQMSQIMVLMTNAAGSGNTFTSGSKTIQQGTWDHVAFTYDKTTGIGSTYVNGVLAAQATTAPITPVTTYNMYFGVDPTSNGAGPFYKGSLDEVTLYKSVLSASQIAAIYSGGSAGKAPIDQAPVVSAPPSAAAYTGVPITLTATASDDGLPNPPGMLTYQWAQVSGPGTAAFATPTALTTSATFSAPGTYVVSLTASDSLLTGSASTTVTVTAPPSTPAVSITSPSPNSQVIANTPFTITSTATDTGGTIVRVDFYSGTTLLGSAPGPELGMPTTWFINVTGLGVGSYTLTAVATDNNGFTATSAPVNVTAIADPGPVYVALTTPADGDNIGNKVPVTGVVSSSILTSWSASYRLMANEGHAPNPWTTFATGTGTIGTQGATPATDVPGAIGTFDPMLLLNGIYEIQLAATDISARTSIVGPIDVVVEGAAKIGQFTLAFNDLTVPAPGIPITITRTYDSRDSRTGDFGPGWFIGVDDIRVQKNGVIGVNWYQTVLNPLAPIQFYYLTPDSERIVSIVMPDGTDYRFMAGAFIRDPDRTGDPDDASLSAVTAGKLKFYPIGDTVGTLQPLDSSNNLDDTYLVLGTGDTELDTDDGTALYDPSRFLFTTKDGTAYILDQNLGLIQVTDLSGNTLVLNRDANNNLTSIVSTQNAPSGPVVTTVSVHRSASGAVDYITDLAGNKLNYAYDSMGRLSGFTDRVQNTTQFFYENASFPDYLTRVVDPLGNQAIRTVYDATGHMIQQIDANGKVTNFAPGTDANGNFEQITDRLGNVTKNYYDDQGNVLLKIDPLGGQTISTFDANNDQTSVTDPLGNRTTMTFDSQKNLLTQTDPLGDTTSYTYNTQSQPLTITDALGHTTTNAYDANGDLTQTTDALGHATKLTYDSAGDLLTTTDAASDTTTNAFDGSGNLIQTTDALGHATTYTYDANRNRLSLTTTRTKSDSTIETLTTNYAYDASSRLTVTTYPDGSTSQTAYNAIGKQGSTTDPLRRVTSFGYNALGNLIATTYPDATSETSSYDADGNVVTTTDKAGHTTTTAFDALNRAMLVAYADGSSTRTGYDAASRVVTSTDALGNVTSYGYDAAGRRTSVKDALNNTTASVFDADGNLSSVTDALSHTTNYSYDALNRRIQVTFPDSTTQITTYDVLGRKIASTDQAGVATQFAYDALGRLISVTQAATSLLPAAVTSYAYDELGHEISQTDALGHKTLYAYDSLGRRIGRTLPGGQSESYAYDEDGNVTSRKDFNGYSTTYLYDTLNRLTEKDADPTHPSLTLGYAPAKTTYAYNAMGQRTAAANLTIGGTMIYSEALTYDVRNRVLTKSRTLNSLGSSSDALNYTYDAQGNLSTLKSSNTSGVDLAYGYDALNRLSTVSTNDQQAGARKVSDYTYDTVGNLNSVTLPNTVTSLYTYDTLNRLTVLNVNLGAGMAFNRFAYTLSPTGQRTQVVEMNNRTTTYAYDTRYRLTQEAVTAGPLDPAPAGSVNYTYDQVGNRLASTSSLSGVSAQTNSFDQDDRLGSDTYDANGNTKAATLLGSPVADIYDFENHLLNRNVGQVQIAYDCDGNRVAKTVGTNTTTFLVDENNPTGYAQVLEEKVNGALTRTYAYGTGLLSGGQFSGGAWKTSYYAFDGHGSTRFLSDATGTATDFYTYDAFGNLIYKNGATANAYLYCGEQYDADLGMYSLRARYMEPGRGRFWTEDGYEGIDGSPNSLHKYLYCSDSPIDYSDPSGNDSLAEFAVTVAVSGALDAIALPSIRGVVGNGFAAAGFVPGQKFSISSLGVDSDAPQILSDSGISISDFSDNLLASAATDIASDAISGTFASLGGTYLLGAFADASAARIPLSSVTDYTYELSKSGSAGRYALRSEIAGAGGQVHHIIPWELRTDPFVIKAARGGFNINGELNGIRLTTDIHSGSHPIYTDDVRQALIALNRKFPNESPVGAAALVNDLVKALLGRIDENILTNTRIN